MNYAINHISTDELVMAWKRSGRSVTFLERFITKLGYKPRASIRSTIDQLCYVHRSALKDKLNSNECYTPGVWVEFAKDVFQGEIDLDVASSDLANEVVKARRFFTWESDTFNQPFEADNLFCNPPFEATLIKKFAAKMVSDRYLYHQAIFLCNASVNSAWNQSLQQCCDALLLPSERIQFWSEGIPPDERYAPSGNNMYQQMCFYFGPNADRFVDIAQTRGLGTGFKRAR